GGGEGRKGRRERVEPGGGTKKEAALGARPCWHVYRMPFANPATTYRPGEAIRRPPSLPLLPADSLLGRGTGQGKRVSPQ
ncbi:MAG TPA: hypothetical protein PKD12_14600, partial [Nitrospira sp.]|nr:hypothetical protein [Nitrospira sp.]